MRPQLTHLSPPSENLPQTRSPSPLAKGRAHEASSAWSGERRLPARFRRPRRREAPTSPSTATTSGCHGMALRAGRRIGRAMSPTAVPDLIRDTGEATGGRTPVGPSPPGARRSGFKNRRGGRFDERRISDYRTGVHRAPANPLVFHEGERRQETL